MARLTLLVALVALAIVAPFCSAIPRSPYIRHDFQVDDFRPRVEHALQRVHSILNETRNPRYPAEVPHVYDDKYLLAEVATKAAAAGVFNVLEALAPGWWSSNGEAALRARAQGQPVVLRFAACEHCTFERTAAKEIDVGPKEVKQTGWTSSTVKMVKTLHEHQWKFTSDWSLNLHIAAGDTDVRKLMEQHGGLKLVTKTPVEAERSSPRQPVSCMTEELPLNWLVDRLRTGQLDFTINRTTSKTPRRNDDIEAAQAFFEQARLWSRGVFQYFRQLFEVDDSPDAYSLAGGPLMHDDMPSAFSPVAGMFGFDEGRNDGHIALANDLDAVLQEHRRSLREWLESVLKHLPQKTSPVGGLATVESVKTVALLKHLGLLGSELCDAVASVEGMLRSQLVAAVGKEISSADFAEYMDYHTQQMFRADFAPTRFTFAVRRPGKSPEGTVSLEGSFADRASDDNAAPLLTMAKHTEAGQGAPLVLPLSAAVEVAVGGDRYLHALVLHRFSTEPMLDLRLVARARQFSSFILLVGRIAPGNRLEPAAALIVKDRDDLSIPILQETLPTPKEFRDAIESLSPEQQRFAKAFRAMQLSGTLFGICIVQIKPQMELLLSLPHDSLTKEIQLTQDLMKLFIQYQVPPDLLSYDGSAEVSARDKLLAVKGHVATLWATINASREQELNEARGKAEKRTLEEGCVPGDRCFSDAAVQFASAPEPIVETMRMKKAVPQMRMMAMQSPSIQFAMQDSAAAAPTLSSFMESPMDGPMPMPTPPAPRRNLLQTPSPTPPPHGGPGGQALDVEDLSSLPQRLDRRIEALDSEAALRATKLKLGPEWRKREQSGLLSPLTGRQLLAEQQKTERDAAFDLLDALSRSGALPVEHASLHVVLAATHSFEETLIDTVVRGNRNPIESVENSLLIMASTVLGVPAAELVDAAHVERLRLSAPRVFEV